MNDDERRWFALKRPRCDTNEGSETEVTDDVHARETLVDSDEDHLYYGEV